jgi:DNA-binding PadR family transcriptional regulator
MLKIGVLGHLLLGLLAKKERTGWQLTREFDTTLANVWAASHSQIYPELAKLAKAGLIKKTETGPRGSQRYAITAAGLAEVRRWLSQTEPVDTPRAEAMVRVFFLAMLPKDEAVAYLLRQEERHRKSLERYQRFKELAESEGDARRFDLIALEAGMRHETALAEWAAWAAQRVAKDKK